MGFVDRHLQRLGPVLDLHRRAAPAVAGGVGQGLLQDAIGGLVHDRRELARGPVDAHAHGEPAVAMALRRACPRAARPGGGSTPGPAPSSRSARTSPSISPRVSRATSSIVCAPRRASGSRSCSRRAGTGLHQDHVDRVPRRVVQVAGDARALLGGGQTALALGLLLRAARPLLQRLDALAPQAGPLAGEPGRGEDDRAEEELRQLSVAHECGPSSPRRRGPARRCGPRPGLVARLGDRVEREREADRRPEPVVEAYSTALRARDHAEDAERRDAARREGQRGQHASRTPVQVAVAADVAVGQHHEREHEDAAGDDGVDRSDVRRAPARRSP